MGRSRSRSRSPRRGNERERIVVHRSRSRSRERENRRRERDQRPERRREPERERPERMERERMPMARDRRRSRSPSPGGGRWQRGRSPPGRRISDSPPPKKYSSNEPAERREIDESQLEGKTEDEKEMMKLMGFCGFDTTKGKAAEEKKKPDLIPPARKDSKLGSEWLETSTETRTVFIRGEKLVTDTETRIVTISDKEPRKSEERSSHSEPQSPVSDSRAEVSPLMKNKKQKKKKKKKLKAKKKEEERVLDASDLTDSHSPIVKLKGTSCDTPVLEASFGKENIAVSEICLENIPLPPGPPTESKKRSSLVPRSVSLNRIASTPNSPQTSDNVFNKPIEVTPKRYPSPKLDFSHVTPGVHQACDTSTKSHACDTSTKSHGSFQQDTPKSHHHDSPMSRGHRSFEGNRSYENPQIRHNSSSRFSPRFSPGTPSYSEGSKNYHRNSSPFTRRQSERFKSYPATPHSINRHASYCTRCFEEGHYVRDCKNPKRCRVCRVLGHYPGSPRCEYYSDSPYIMPFQGAGDILSNFYPCNITIYAEEFHSSEQAYQYKKAVEWNMTSVADQIMAAPTARDVKVLCNWALKGPPGDHEEFKLSIMRDVLRAKALQVPAYRDLLMDADPKMVFGEATTDLFWATGLVREETRNTCPERWPGKNTLGKLHRELAEELKIGEYSFGQSNEQKSDPPKEVVTRKDEEPDNQWKNTQKRRSSSSSASSNHSSSSHTTYSSSSDSESDSSDGSYSHSKKKRKQRSSSKGSKYKIKSKKGSKSKSVKSDRVSADKKSKGKKSKRKRYSSASSSSDGGKRKAPTSPSHKDIEKACKRKKSDI